MRLSRVLRLVIVPLFLMSTVGCVTENKDLEGTRWESEAGAVQVNNPAVGKRSVHVSAGFMKLDFKKDGTLFYIIANKLYRGKYSLGGGKSVTFHLEEKLSGTKTHTEKIIVEGSRLTMTDSDGTQLKFQKVQ
jgi:hypothetical protein